MTVLVPVCGTSIFASSSAGAMGSRPSGGKGYVVAVAAVAASAAVRGVLTPLWGDEFPLVTFYPAVMLAAWYGGFGPGLVAAALSTALACMFRPSLASEVTPLVLFALINALIVALLAGLQRARRRAEAAPLRSAFLAEASSVLASSLDYEGTS